MVYNSLLPHGYTYIVPPYSSAIFSFESLLARALRRAEILSSRLPYVSFAKRLQSISIKLGIRIYTDSFFAEFNFDSTLPSVETYRHAGLRETINKSYRFFFFKLLIPKKLVRDVTTPISA
jgi:hypothetical protein